MSPCGLILDLMIGTLDGTQNGVKTIPESIYEDLTPTALAHWSSATL